MKNVTLSPAKIVVIVICVILAIAAAVFFGYSLSGPDPADEVPHNGKGLISSENAMKIALDDAGLERTQVSTISCQFDDDENNMTYEVEFVSGSSQHEYIISAEDGTVISSTVENIKVTGTQPMQGPQPEDTATAERLSETQAKDVALAHAGLKEADISGLKVTADTDDVYDVYDVEFRTDTMKYELEINAFTGAVYKYDVESVLED